MEPLFYLLIILIFLKAAFDDNWATYWHSRAYANSWFRVNFRNVYQLCQIRLRTISTNNAWELRYKDMTVSLYNQGELVHDWLTTGTRGEPFNEDSGTKKTPNKGL